MDRNRAIKCYHSAFEIIYYVCELFLLIIQDPKFARYALIEETHELTMWLIYYLNFSSDSEIGQVYSHKQGLITSLDNSQKVTVLLRASFNFDKALLAKKLKSIEVCKRHDGCVLFFQVTDHKSA